jgi:exodeoxyribonuclease-5
MTPSPDQSQALEKLIQFVDPENPLQAFILRGSAGTGKTTLVKSALDQLPKHYETVELCAFTNKAAKVLSQKTNIRAITLHRLLYQIDTDHTKATIQFRRRTFDADKPTLILVDEASMVGDRSVPQPGELFESASLLTDLLQFVFSGHENNKIIFIGDPCQLPPIGYQAEETAPALDLNYLRTRKKLKVDQCELTTVHRQRGDSHILDAATAIRDHLLYQANYPAQFSRRELANPTAAIRKYLECFDPADESLVKLLAWRNVDVNWWNDALRKNLGLADRPLEVGTQVLIDRNWSDGKTIVSKGETGLITACADQPENFAGLRFLPVRIQTMNIDGEPFEIEAKALLEHLESKNGFIEPETERLIRAEALKYNEALRDDPRPFRDPYVGSLRLRYGYAITCHKAQGSEYKNLILHPIFPKDDKRWLYTAITRAKEELYTFNKRL